MSKKPLKSGTLADLVAVTMESGKLGFHVFESKYSAAAGIAGLVGPGRSQARATADVLNDEYLNYEGLDRRFRLEALRDIVQFHLARAERHAVPVAFAEQDVRQAFDNDDLLRDAGVTCAVVGWTPQGLANAGPVTSDDDVDQWLMGAEDVEQYLQELDLWPPRDVGNRTGVVRTDATANAATVSILQTSQVSPNGEESSEPESAPGSAESAPSSGPIEPSVARHQEAGDLGAGSRVRDPECVRLGSIATSGKPAVWCPPLLSNGHLVLIGGSGSGKTTTLRHITGQLRSAGVPVLILDFHGDITPAGSREQLYRFQYADNSVFVNPFHLDPRYNLIPLRLRDQFIEAWKRRYFSMGIQQYNYLVDLIDEAFASKGITANPETWTRRVDFGDVIAAFEGSTAPDVVKDKIRAYMRNFSEWRIFHGGEGIAVERFLEESTRLDLSQLDENARGILADVVLRRLFLLCNAIGPLQDRAGWEKFRAYVVIDEAQILMGSQGDAKASLSRYTAEARKFGIGLILATQLKDNIPEEIWGNVDTRLFMQALDPVERSRNARAAGVPEDALRTLKRGEAILITSSQPLQRPLRVRIEPSWLG